MGETDQYVLAVVGRNRAAGGAPETIRRRLLPLLQRWAGSDLEAVTLAGSYAKGTAIRNRPLVPSDVDVDLFIGLRPEARAPLAELYGSLAESFRQFQSQPRNVAVRILLDGASVDLVPGRRRPGSHGHTLWQHRYSTWLQTDIGEQARYVRSSGAALEILAAKIWKRHRALRFPSFCLELAVIRALHDSPAHGPAARLLAALEFLADGFPAARIADPGNSNNVVSAAMTGDEKARVAEAARRSLAARQWSDIF